MDDRRECRTVIVGTGMANIGSVVNMCRRLGTEPLVTTDQYELMSAERLILPGVGAFDVAMKALTCSGIDDVIRMRVAEGAPLLGICLGMQLLFDSSEEGSASGLGLIPGSVRRLAGSYPAGQVRIPHMGWSRMERRGVHPLLAGIDDDARYYFVHSFAAVPMEDQDVIGVSVYGSPFVSAVARENVMGVQFHPEKSHRYGKALLGNFLRTV